MTLLRSSRWSRLLHAFGLSFALSLVLAAPSLAAAPPTYAERMYARALDSFRQGRFPEAYGRFIDLANTGHPAAARYALWMCEQGPALFGKDWDCAPHEVEDWSRAGGLVVPQVSSARHQAPARSLQATRR